VRQTKTFEDLKDSALLYEKTLPTFGYAILFVLLALVCAVVVWSVKTPKVYIVKSTGSVQSENKNYVMSPYTGKIASIGIAEGSEVEKGEVLLTVKSTELDLQDEQLISQKQIYGEQIEQYNKLVRSLQEDANLFDPSDPDDNLYYSQFEMYKSQVAQQKPDMAMLKMYGYTDEQIASEIEKSEGKVSELYYSAIHAAEEQILQAQTQTDAIDAQLGAVETGQSDYLVTANESGRIHMLGDYREGMVVQAASAVASIGTENDRYRITAYVAASDAARIGEGDEVSIAIAGLAQNVYGTLPGWVTRIDSDVTIPQGGENGETATPYFKAEITPDESYLVSKDGHKVSLSNGMAVEVRIQYDKVSYFDYVWESLGMKVRG